MEIRGEAPKPYNVGRFVLLIVAVWTVLLALSCAWDLYSSRHETVDAARIQAIESYKKDILYRRWNTEHGGVYVPVSDDVKPNRYLIDTPERDIVTPSGKTLTLMNPAYMSRQVFSLVKEEYGMLAHITSLRPINPLNKPDEWEAAALISFSQLGSSEMSSIETIEGVEYMRLMRPLYVEEQCIGCHVKQGYKKGEISGGISVAVPMAPLWAGWKSHIKVEIAVYCLIWFVGLMGIVAAKMRLEESEKQRVQAEEARERLVVELTESLENVKTLSGLLPVCATCKRVRDDTGYWSKVETYIQKHSSAEITHGICPECSKKMIEESRDL